jgi:hypothetical protein
MSLKKILKVKQMSNYISADRFISLDKKVQDKIMEWWKPQLGDIFSTYFIYDEIDVVIDWDDSSIFGMNDNFKKHGDIFVCHSLNPFPLLSETQLRTYIENTIKGGVNIYSDEEGYTMKVQTDKGWLLSSSTDLLECYLDIAVKVS